MAAGLDGDIKLGLDLKTKSASNALDSFRKKVKDSLSGADTKGLEQNIKNTEKNIKSLEKEIDKTKSKIQDLSQSDTQPKSIIAMEKELEKVSKEADTLGKKLEELQIKRSGLDSKGTASATRKTPVEYKGRFYSEKDAQALQLLDNQIADVERRFNAATDKSIELGQKLQQLKANPQLTDEARKYNKELDEATRELEEQKKKHQQLQDEQRRTTGITAELPKAFQAFGKVLTRIQGLIKRVFFFTIISKFLRALKEGLSGIISQNNALQSSLNQIKGNLLTAFAPIWETIIPWLQTFLNILAKVTSYIAVFINMLMGKSVAASKASAKALQEQAAAAKASGGANKKAGEEAEKSSLSFDTLNTITSPKEDTSGGGGTKTPTFETSDLTLTDEIEKKLQAILVLVGTIGGALLAWKITEFVTALIAGDANALKLLGKLKMVGGILMIVAGAILLVKGYTDAWVNGIDWSNFLLILGGVALLIGGIALAISPAAAAFAAIGAGIALVVLGVKDFIENGASFQNILMIIIGLAVIFAATWMLASLPIALIVVAIAALVAGFVLLWNKCEGFRNFWIGLWQNIKDTAISMWDNYIKPTLDYIGQKFTELWNNYIKPTWEEHLKPAFEQIGQKLNEVWEKLIKPALEFIGDKFMWLWENILSPFINNFLLPLFVGQFKNAFDSVMDIIKVVMEWIQEKIDAIKNIFTGLIDFVVGVFTGDWDKALGGIKTAFGGIIDSIKADFKAMINLVISMINGFIRGVNLGIDIINKIPGVNIPALGEIPKLAQGAVLPPNKPFAAIVGDQKHGTNIEAPLDTIVEAVMIALSKTNFGNNGDINVNFTGNLSQLARILKPEIQREEKRGSTRLVRGGAY